MTVLFGYRASLVLRDDAGEGIEIVDGFLKDDLMGGGREVHPHVHLRLAASAAVASVSGAS